MAMRLCYQIHRWVSLVCALFFLMLTLTGLPMLFRDELRAWNTVNLPAASDPMPQREIWQALPEGFAAVAARFPSKEIRAVTPNPADGTLYFLVQDKGSKTAEHAHMRMGGEQIMYDVRTGEVFNRKERAYRGLEKGDRGGCAAARQIIIRTLLSKRAAAHMYCTMCCSSF